MSRVRKLSVSLDPDLLAELREAAAEQHQSVSGWLAAAARRQLKLRQADRVLKEWQAENGAFTEDERAEADGRWFS